MSKVKWQRGSYSTFIANIKIRVGGVSDIAIESGDSFEYDGTILKYAGLELNSISLRGAIDRDWASLSTESGTKPKSIHASRNVAKSQTVNKDLSRVERLSSDSMLSDSLDENTVMDITDRRDPNDSKKVLGVSLNNSAPRALTKENIGEDAYSQEGVTVGKLRTSAKLNVDVTKDAGRSASRLENLSGSGYIKDESTIEKEGVSITSNLKRMSSSVEIQDESDGEIIGSVRHTDDKPPAKKSVVRLDKKLDPKIRIARVIDPEFPLDWSFSGKLAERLKRAKEHGDSPTFIQALYAAEGDQMRKVLEKEYPKVVL